jgi:hypothetical protein
MEENKNGLLDPSKLSFEDLKKTEQGKHCYFEDFQPLLEYSSWKDFEGMISKVIRLCKKVHHYRSSHYTDLQILTKTADEELEQTISKKMVQASFLEEAVEKIPKGKKRIRKCEKEDLLKSSLDVLFAHRKKYSTFCSCDHPPEGTKKPF